MNEKRKTKVRELTMLKINKEKDKDNWTESKGDSFTGDGSMNTNPEKNKMNSYKNKRAKSQKIINKPKEITPGPGIINQ